MSWQDLAVFFWNLPGLSRRLCQPEHLLRVAGGRPESAQVFRKQPKMPVEGGDAHTPTLVHLKSQGTIWQRSFGKGELLCLAKTVTV